MLAIWILKDILIRSTALWGGGECIWMGRIERRHLDVNGQEHSSKNVYSCTAENILAKTPTPVQLTTFLDDVQHVSYSNSDLL